MKINRRLLLDVTSNDVACQVGIMVGDKVIYQPQYSFLGNKVPDDFEMNRAKEIAEAFAYLTGLTVVIRARGQTQIVKYNALDSQFIK
jgi:hypothetical protein